MITRPVPLSTSNFTPILHGRVTQGDGLSNAVRLVLVMQGHAKMVKVTCHYMRMAEYIAVSSHHRDVLVCCSTSLLQALRNKLRMAVGKNKKIGKKGAKKKVVDPFTRKEWYDIKAPSMFNVQHIGKTLVNRTQGTKIASEGLKGRVYEVSLGDLNNAESEFRKMRLICEDVQGRTCLTNFHGMRLTRDKLCSIVKKWHTLIEANVAVKTSDGYLLRLFCIGFTKKNARQLKKTSYAKSSKIRQIRAKMVEYMQKEVQGSDLKDVCHKLVPDSIGKDIEKACSYIYPLQDVCIRKVKILKKPKFEIGRLMEMHTDVSTFTSAEGEKIERPDDYEPPVQESV